LLGSPNSISPNKQGVNAPIVQGFVFQGILLAIVDLEGLWHDGLNQSSLLENES
jgi:hypothetical protein